MKILLPAAIVAAAAFGTSAAADGIVERCYLKVYEPAEYAVTHRRVRDESHVYVDHGSRVDLVRHPAWYVEQYRQTRADRYVLKPVDCN